ncbi:hypothetical protein UlMin_019804 [Ulmus minor]
MAPEANKTLQAICYNRGSLQLLDQRKLPLETTNLKIQDLTDGWTWWFMVRLLLAAALSLVVEVSNLESFDVSTDDAISYLIMKLDYLVSRYAVTKLKEITSKAVAAASEAKSIFQIYIDAAEIMLEDDVASNNWKKLSVLTHCNTGGLATTGFGTTLGVICALHTEGVLERAYCTETHPFNQVIYYYLHIKKLLPTHKLKKNNNLKRNCTTWHSHVWSRVAIPMAHAILGFRGSSTQKLIKSIS